MSAKFRVGLIGEGISESLTPAMHMREAARRGIAYEYHVLDLAPASAEASDLGAYLRELRDAGYAAVNVTHPFKQRIIPCLDVLSEAAATIDAVNLVLIGEQFAGENTDWSAFEWAIATGLPGSAFGLVAQVGAGGAGSATAYALLRHGAGEVAVLDVDIARAYRVAELYTPLFPGQRIRAEPLDALPDVLARADGVVHATPVGMARHPGTAFDVRMLAPHAWLAEIVYRPIETELVSAARAHGHRVLDGSRMAVGQAVDSFRLITGVEPDAERMGDHMLELIASRS
jgi:shikimate dehydrogenase